MENELLKTITALTIGGSQTIGNDLVFLPDFKLSFNEQFKAKVYIEAEIAYCEQFSDSLLRYASTWAAKEAVYKAIKQIEPNSPIGPKRIGIIRTKTAGIPQVTVRGYEDYQISLTISHDGDYAWAIALINSCKA